jgi:hypothetical protein
MMCGLRMKTLNRLLIDAFEYLMTERDIISVGGGQLFFSLSLSSSP